MSLYTEINQITRKYSRQTKLFTTEQERLKRVLVTVAEAKAGSSNEQVLAMQVEMT